VKTKGVFYKFSLAPSITFNQDYTISTDDDEKFLKVDALFINTTIGYQFDQRSLIGLNFEYANHWDQQYGGYDEKSLNFFSTYLSYQYNFRPLFLRGGYGLILDMGESFEKGSMYKLGLGFGANVGDKNNSILFGVEFTRKRFGHETLERISSVSFFIEFMIL
jgi:hypothetical protein